MSAGPGHVWGIGESQGPDGRFDQDPDGPAGAPGPSGLALRVFGDLAISLGSVAAEAKRRNDLLDRRINSIPGDAQLIKGGVVDSGGDNLILDLGSVPLGHVWQIRRLVAGGVDITTVAAGKAYAFAQGAPPSDANTANCVEIFSSLPNVDHYGTHELFLLGGEHFFVVIVGGTPNQQYVASAKIEEWAEDVFHSVFNE